MPIARIAQEPSHHHKVRIGTKPAAARHRHGVAISNAASARLNATFVSGRAETKMLCQPRERRILGNHHKKQFRWKLNPACPISRPSPPGLDAKAGPANSKRTGRLGRMRRSVTPAFWPSHGPEPQLQHEIELQVMFLADLAVPSLASGEPGYNQSVRQ